MNLFSEIEGRRGEELTSAVLRFLILRSQEGRETFRTLVSRSSKQGPIVMHEEFSCRSEVSMKDSQNDSDSEQVSSSGRIDLLIQTDNAIIGVENKLDANFQTGQPEKYLVGLEQLARLQRTNSEQRKYIAVILAPRDRNAEIKEMISDHKDTSHYVQLDWEDLLDQLRNACSKNSDRISQILIDQLYDYIISNRRFWPSELYADHLRGVFDPHGVHGEFIRKLTRIISAASRLGTGKTSIGYLLDIPARPDTSLPDRTWLGFVTSDILENSTHKSELILITTISETSIPPPQSLRQVRMKEPWWKDRPMHMWAIDYDDNEAWKRSATWRDLFEFLFKL